MIIDEEFYKRIKEVAEYDYEADIYLTKDKVKDIILDLMYILSATKTRCEKLEEDLFNGGTNFKEDQYDRD